MLQWALSLAVLIVMFGGALAFIAVSKSRWRRRYQANPDRALLEGEQLAPEQKYEFEFVLTFPDEASARRAETRLRAENYATEIEYLGRPHSDLPWDCSAKRWMYPSE